ncbi:M20/M25/M40 family metallo-hydrolase [Pyrinomonas methylaliphatogenes]|uniref:Peptidase T-like protein n=1 Tax=Pyrinomonas methylaliphatogenes TaxID=454194 RepID=A0A0B6X1V4_9BACT|nr:M20/M25/M40 family metallo-hydrolase [Pyrinomonas methylaliphatogenes]CDM66350.1 peptidase T-like protein [Pyrinomonas methylaliphatogenes]
MINLERMRQTFLDLVQIDSHSRHERRVAEYLKRRCEALGAEVEIDDAGEKVGGDTGNLIARFRGTVPDAPPFLFSSHMDTVTPGEGIRPIVEGDIIRSDGRTILGSDDKSGIAIILETIQTLRERAIPHPDLEVVFSICEEIGLLGAKHLDEKRLRARLGIVFDAEDPNEIFTRGPSGNHIEFRIHGLEAHAGIAPEQGISAIKIAAEAIAAMRLGRIDEETTANIGQIEGGRATNIIPNLVTLKGEARSLDERKLDEQTRHMVECVHRAAERYEVTLDGKTIRARVEETIERNYPALNVPDDARLVQLIKRAAERLGRQVKTVASGGGSDANFLNGKGIECVVVGTGMRAIHTVNEWIDLKDMRAAAELAIEVIRLHVERS